MWFFCIFVPASLCDFTKGLTILNVDTSHMEVLVDVGGRPGWDCKGFCDFCYFKGVYKVDPFGCRRCKPFKLGCDYCSREVIDIKPGFMPLEQAVFEVAQKSLLSKPERIIISGEADLSCYPYLLDLVKRVSMGSIPVCLDYTSGKGFAKGNEAEELIYAGVRRVSFSIFSTNLELRRKYVKDRHPEMVMSNFRTFCEGCDAYGMIVLLPGINDGLELEKTWRDLEEMGAKGLMLMSFANTSEQGLIFGNGPVMPEIKPFTVEDIKRISTEISESSDMRVIGTPLWDPNTGAPFSLASHKEELGRLPEIEKSATLITSSIAYPLLSSIFQEMGNKVNVVPVNKEIGNLITLDDFKALDLKNIKERVMVPGMVLAHDKEILKALRRDGRNRLVFRGPDNLSVESERSIYLTLPQVLDKEIEAFSGLIHQINDLGL
jgi:methanogenesis marker radical SAM protein